jgi:hypothetical protein
MGFRMDARPWARRIWSLPLWLLLPGCVTTLPWIGNHEAGANSVSQVAVNWESRIFVTQDSVNGGRPLIGLAGRLYLFDDNLKLQKGDGRVSVDLFDAGNTQPGAQPKRLERWELDQASLSKLLRKDPVGWGYTLFLPWGTYRPDIARVQMTVCYTPAKGMPIYADPAMVSLRSEAHLTQTRQVPAQNSSATSR